MEAALTVLPLAPVDETTTVDEPARGVLDGAAAQTTLLPAVVADNVGLTLAAVETGARTVVNCVLVTETVDGVAERWLVAAVGRTPVKVITIGRVVLDVVAVADAPRGPDAVAATLVICRLFLGVDVLRGPATPGDMLDWK